MAGPQCPLCNLKFMSIPPISVVLPVFNAERFVAVAIQSVLAQSCGDFEFLIIDDGSTDSSLEVIKSAVGRDVRCHVRSRANIGLVATCNEAVAMARGEYIFRMDQDDISHPQRFGAQIAYLTADRDCVALGTRVMLADEDLMPIIEAFKFTAHDEIDTANISGSGSAICHPSAAIRRTALLAIGGYRKEYEWAEDLDLFLRLAEVGRLANLPDVLLTYRQHASSVGYSKRELQRERAAAATRSAMRRRTNSIDCDQDKPIAKITDDPGPSRIESDYESVADIHRKWAWLSLIGGNLRTARKHAFRAFSMDPLSMRNAKLIGCVIRGH